MMQERTPRPKETDTVESKVGQSFLVAQAKKGYDELYCSYYLEKKECGAEEKEEEGKEEGIEEAYQMVSKIQAKPQEEFLFVFYRK